jgi:ATP-GRASP peptide maturase of grasp-with-spasm system
MILIQSKEDIENTTEQVIDWLDYQGKEWLRLNGEDLLHSQGLSAKLPIAKVRLNGIDLPISRIKVVWHRRGGKYKIDLPSPSSPLHYELLTYLKAEARSFRDSIPSFFPQAIHLDHPNAIRLNKLEVLHQAVRAGLQVPQTLVTNCQAEVREFAQACGSHIIAKSLYEASQFTVDAKYYVVNTQRIEVESLPEVFYVTLFQEELQKDYELRVFCLDNELYAMAIFSQLDEKTKVDFRNYNVRRPNRVVPYTLPDEISAKVRHLMQILNLTNGSVDMVRTLDGSYVFLEVNPTGQFSMVSTPCNYHLEQRMADFLSKKSDEHTIAG